MTRRAALLVATTIVVGAVLSLVGWHWAGGGRDQFAAWVSAVATFAAFAAASVAAGFAIGAYRLETTREHRWEDAQLRAQADLIGGWCQADIRYGYQDGRDHAVSASVTAFLRNASPLPVFHVTIFVTAVLTDGEEGLWPAAEPGDYVEFVELGEQQIQVLPPGADPSEYKIPLPELARLTNIELSDRSPRRYAVALSYEFGDAAGNQWLRESSGVLRHTGRIDGS